MQKFLPIIGMSILMLVGTGLSTLCYAMNWRRSTRALSALAVSFVFSWMSWCVVSSEDHSMAANALFSGVMILCNGFIVLLVYPLRTRVRKLKPQT